MERRYISSGPEALFKDRALPKHMNKISHDDLDGLEPTVEFVVELSFEGVPECREIRGSDSGGRELRQSDLRALLIETELEHVVREFAKPVKLIRNSDGNLVAQERPNDSQVLRETVQQFRSVRRQAKRRVTDDVLREVAEIYRANIDNKPTVAVAEHLDKAHRTATLHVKLAREAGYLGASVRGRAGEQS